MTDQTTPEPLTDDILAAMRDRSQGIDCAREADDSAEDVPRLLDEVDRLRAERDRLYTETLRLGISLAETIRERQQARQALGATQRDRAAALDVAADLTAERDQARAEIDRQRHEREKYTERWDALDLQRLAALELHALPFCETCNDHGPCETRRALDGDGVTACTGCGRCSVCRRGGVTAHSVLGIGPAEHIETTTLAAVHEAEPRIVDPVEEPCDACHGTGYIVGVSHVERALAAAIGPDQPCSECDGTGRAIVTNPAHDAAEREAPVCMRASSAGPLLGGCSARSIG